MGSRGAYRPGAVVTLLALTLLPGLGLVCPALVRAGPRAEPFVNRHAETETPPASDNGSRDDDRGRGSKPTSKQQSDTRPPSENAGGAGYQGGGAPPRGLQSIMNDHVRAALRHMVNHVREIDRYYTRFFSFYDIDAVAPLRTNVKLSNWWNNQMSFGQAARLMRPVAGTGLRLFAFDLRYYNWNSPAWEAVARRDPRFRQPWVNFRDAEELRREAGYYDVRPSGDDTTPVVVVVSATWFLRDTIETNRSPSYYDLLFASKRFVVDREEHHEFKFVTATEQQWPGGVDPDDGHYYEKGTYTVRKTHYRTTQDWRAFTFHDFPKDEDELERGLGIDKVAAFAEKEQYDIDNGAIVEGGRDKARTGSIVALQNRLIAVLEGPLGPYMETFDVLRTSGLRDYSQSLFFAGRPYRKGARARAVRDAGEILFYLPNGAQGGLLVDGNGKRIELAAATVANDTADTKMNPGVRTYGSCAVCHAGGGGYVPPNSVHKKWKELGIKLRFRDPEQEQRVEAFFEGLKDRLASATRRYENLTEATTRPFLDEPEGTKPWSGAEVAAEVQRFRSNYDEEVDVKLAALEMGLPLPAFKWLAVRAGVEDENAEGRVERRDTPAKVLLQGGTIPRSVWDDDVFRQIGLLQDAYANKADFKKLFDTVQVPYEKGG